MSKKNLLYRQEKERPLREKAKTCENCGAFYFKSYRDPLANHYQIEFKKLPFQTKINYASQFTSGLGECKSCQKDSVKKKKDL